MCTTCVVTKVLHDAEGRSKRVIDCPACNQHLERARLKSANWAISKYAELTVTTCCPFENTERAEALLDLLEKDCSKVLLAGVTTDDRAKISALLKQEGIRHCCPGDVQNSSTGIADISGALEDFVENSETRVLILPKQLKQGVDKTKVARKVVFFD